MKNIENYKEYKIDEHLDIKNPLHKIIMDENLEGDIIICGDNLIEILTWTGNVRLWLNYIACDKNQYDEEKDEAFIGVSILLGDNTRSEYEITQYMTTLWEPVLKNLQDLELDVRPVENTLHISYTNNSNITKKEHSTKIFQQMIDAIKRHPLLNVESLIIPDEDEFQMDLTVFNIK